MRENLDEIRSIVTTVTHGDFWSSVVNQFSDNQLRETSMSADRPATLRAVGRKETSQRFQRDLRT
jgi:hypothetical protein